MSDLPLLTVHATPPNSKTKKLLATLWEKKNYVLHYRTLKQALAQGVKLKKIHKILKFRQSNFLQEYIDCNISRRINATNPYDKLHYKNLSNILFGKFIECLRKRSKIYLRTSWDGRAGAEYLISKVNFKRLEIFDENFVAIELNKLIVEYDRPIYVGFAILEIAKVLLNDFHYNFIWPRYGQNARLIYHDTDSLLYSFSGGLDPYVMIRENIERFDTSNFSPDNVFKIPPVNQGLLGLMKSEVASNLISEVVTLSPKMYALLLDNLAEIKKAKGIKKYIIEKKLTFDQFMQCLFQNKITICRQNSIRSKKQKVYTIRENKTALVSRDNKRYQIANSHFTLPYGHKDIEKIEANNNMNVINENNVMYVEQEGEEPMDVNEV